MFSQAFLHLSPQKLPSQHPNKTPIHTFSFLPVTSILFLKPGAQPVTFSKTKFKVLETYWSLVWRVRFSLFCSFVLFTSLASFPPLLYIILLHPLSHPSLPIPPAPLPFLSMWLSLTMQIKTLLMSAGGWNQYPNLSVVVQYSNKNSALSFWQQHGLSLLLTFKGNTLVSSEV